MPDESMLASLSDSATDFPETDLSGIWENLNERWQTAPGTSQASVANYGQERGESMDAQSSCQGEIPFCLRLAARRGEDSAETLGVEAALTGDRCQDHRVKDVAVLHKQTLLYGMIHGKGTVF